MKDTILPHSEKQNEQPVVEKLAYSLREAAAALGISYISVFRLVQRGKLKTVRALRHHIVPREELQRFLRENLNAA